MRQVVPLRMASSRYPVCRGLGRRLCLNRYVRWNRAILKQLCERQDHEHVEIECDLRIGKPALPVAVVVEKIIEMPPVLDGVHHGTVPVHLFERPRHTLIETDAFEEPIQKPVQEKSRLVVQHRRVIRFFL